MPSVILIDRAANFVRVFDQFPFAYADMPDQFACIRFYDPPMARHSPFSIASEEAFYFFARFMLVAMRMIRHVFLYLFILIILIICAYVVKREFPNS